MTVWTSCETTMDAAVDVTVQEATHAEYDVIVLLGPYGLKGRLLLTEAPARALRDGLNLLLDGAS